MVIQEGATASAEDKTKSPHSGDAGPERFQLIEINSTQRVGAR